MFVVTAALLLVWSAEVAVPGVPPEIFPSIEFDLERCHSAARSGRDDVAACDSLLGHPGATPQAQIDLLESRARVHQNAQRLELAEADLTAALHLDPERGRLYINRANLRMLRGDARAALSDYNLAVDLTFAREPRAFYNRAFAHRALGNLQAAIDDFDMARIVAESSLRTREARAFRFQ